MANNETSGISVLTYLAKWIKSKKRNFSYRIIFVPETVGSIAYIKKNFIKLKKDVIAGLIITCVGDNKKFSYIPSRYGNTLSDFVSLEVLKKIKKNSILIVGLIEEVMKDNFVHQILNSQFVQ